MIHFFHDSTKLSEVILKHNNKVIGSDVTTKIGQGNAKGSTIQWFANRNDK